MCLKTGTIIYGIDDAWSLLWLLMSFFVIWTGFFAAMKIDEDYVKVTNGIKNFGSSIGQSALKLPMSIPIPTGGGKSMTLNQLKNAPRRLSANLENQSAGKAIAGAFGGGGSGGDSSVADTLRDPNNPMVKALAKIAQNTNSAANVNTKTGAIGNFGAFKIEIENQLSNKNSPLQQEFRNQGLSEEQIKKIKPEELLDGLNQDAITSAIKKTLPKESEKPTP